MSYPTSPEFQQKMMQLDQEYAQRKANLVHMFQSQNNNVWSNPAPITNPQPALVPVQNVSWISVNGMQGAKEHQVPANATHWLMDSNDSVFYVKSSDEFGVSKQLKAFRFVEVDLSAAVPDNSQPQIDESKYVQREEFDELKSKIEQMSNKKQASKSSTNKEDSENG